MDNKNNNGRTDFKLLNAEIEKCLKDISKETVLENKVNKISYVLPLILTYSKENRNVSCKAHCHLKNRVVRLENRRGYNQAS